jgi:hypothetical protein
VYRERVTELAHVLEADDASEARELVRSLVETITLVPEDGGLRIEVRGELAAILRMAQGAERARSADGDADALAEQIKMVAGARSHCSAVYRSSSPILRRTDQRWSTTALAADVARLFHFDCLC